MNTIRNYYEKTGITAIMINKKMASFEKNPDIAKEFEHWIQTKEYTIEGKDCLKSGTTLGVYINNLESDEMRDVLSVTVKKNGVVVSATQVFSGESALVDGLLNTYPDLANALMNYADCAYAVFGHLALSA